MNQKQTLAMLFSSVALLSGCGGGSDAPAPPPPPTAATDAIPGDAGTTAAKFKSYLVDLSADTPDTKEALDVSTFSPKQDDDTEPEPVN
ncbi:hypothetical protein [Piscinibacter terrae]|uniref:Uncharacterized protein n=1 Tax=Piscinibacter terrae TaxID=2496871 RepID=A0A3N7JXP7_9BURK|nr:hypothetical protein [Albitalea terrae]RQP23665.1 hypothetical protein DZC73_16170 [Albitalea terrae]